MRQSPSSCVGVLVRGLGVPSPFAGFRPISSRSTALSKIAPSSVTVMLIDRAESGGVAASFAAIYRSTVSNVIASRPISAKKTAKAQAAAVAQPGRRGPRMRCLDHYGHRLDSCNLDRLPARWHVGPTAPTPARPMRKGIDRTATRHTAPARSPARHPAPTPSFAATAQTRPPNHAHGAPHEHCSAEAVTPHRPRITRPPITTHRTTAPTRPRSLGISHPPRMPLPTDAAPRTTSNLIRSPSDQRSAPDRIIGFCASV